MGWRAALLVFGLLLAAGAGARSSTRDILQDISVSPKCLSSLLQSLPEGAGNGTTDPTAVVTIAVNAFILCDALNAAPLRAISVLAPSNLDPFILELAQIYEQATGFAVEFTFLNIDVISAAIKVDFANNLTQAYDGWIIQPTSLSAIAAHHGLLSLDTLVAGDSFLDWSDVHPFFRKVSTVYAGHVIGLPLSGEASVLYYRRDVFDAHNVSVPNTWDELIAVAAALNGSDFDGDGVGDYALCFQAYGDCLEGGSLLGQIFAPLTQYQGVIAGWLFDPATLDTFVDGPAMAYALGLFGQLLPFNWPDYTVCATINARLQSQQCAVTIKWSEGFKYAEAPGSLIQGRLASAVLPGHPYVFDRDTGLLTTCDATVCPYAEHLLDSSGGEQWVNRSPYFLFGSFGGVVNALGDPGYQGATYNFFAFLASGDVSIGSTLSTFLPVGPYRLSMMEPASVPIWVSAGYNATDTADFLAKWLLTLNSPNIALDLRLPGSADFTSVIQTMAWNMTLADPDIPAILAAAGAAFDVIIAANGGTSAVLAGYQGSIGYNVPSPPPPPPHRPSKPPAPASTSSGLSRSILGAAIAVPVVVVALLLVGVLLLRRSSFKTHIWRPRFLQRRATLGPEMALLVTEIEDSETMWAMLSDEVMCRVQKLHAEVFQERLAAYKGHESRSEGDSRIIAFTTSAEALEYAIAVQQALMLCAWPQEVLRLEGCQAIWATQVLHNKLGGRSRSTLTTRHGSGSDMRSQISRDLSHYNLSQYNMDRQGLQSFVAPATSSTALLRSGTMGTLGPASRAFTSLLTNWESDSPTAAADALDTRTSMPSLENGFSGGLSITLPHEAHDVGGGFTMVRSGQIESSVVVGEFQCFSANTYFKRLWQVEAGGSSSSETHSAQPPSSLTDLQNSNRVLAFRGPRVRMGITCSSDNSDDQLRRAASLQSEQGPLATQGVCNAAQGGMILLNEAAFKRLDAGKTRASCLLLNAGEHRLVDKYGALGRCVLYQAVGLQLMQRSAILGPLRTAEQLQRGLGDAPMGRVTIAFMKVAGMSMLLDWNKAVTADAIAIYDSMVTARLQLHDGYLVELSDGLCLAAFQTPDAAVRWSCSVVEQLKHAPWSDDLLAHELCEEMLMGVVGPSVGMSPSMAEDHHLPALPTPSSTEHQSKLPSRRVSACGSLPGAGTWGRLSSIRLPYGQDGGASSLGHSAMNSVLLFRGFRLKVGIDVGQAKAEVSSVTGRMTYRGRVMNRAARVAEKAATGQVTCTGSAWEACQAANGLALPGQQLIADCLGEHVLKGIPEPVVMYSCHLSDVAASAPGRSDRYTPTTPTLYVSVDSARDADNVAYNADFAESPRANAMHMSPFPRRGSNYGGGNPMVVPLGSLGLSRLSSRRHAPAGSGQPSPGQLPDGARAVVTSTAESDVRLYVITD